MKSDERRSTAILAVGPAGILPAEEAGNSPGETPGCPTGKDACATIRLKPLSLFVVFAVAMQNLCYADVTKLPTEDRKVLQDSTGFHETYSTKDLPPTIVALCAGDGRIAEPGQKWNATDAIIDSTLPGKRLIWTAVDGDYYVVHYERGGIAHTFHVLVATLAKGEAKPKVVWSAVGGPFKDYTAFLDALRGGKLDDRLDYGR